MGKFIVCSGKEAERPYFFSLTGTNVYTIEELCYYLYNNIYIFTEESFDISLVKWLREEVNMEDISKKLESLLNNRNDLKDIVVSILCSADYYTEPEIKSLIRIMNEMNELPYVKRQKLKADNFLKYRNYSAALTEYDKILSHESAGELTTRDYGNILHNRAVAKLHITSFREAAKEFKAAYVRNGNKESLKAYFMALRLGKCDKLIEEEARQYGLKEEVLQGYFEEIRQKEQMAEELLVYKDLKKIQDMKESGRVGEYYSNLDGLICKWKKDYRKEIG